MSVLSFIFFMFLGVIAIVVCARMGKIVVKAINHMFDKIEDKFC